MKILLVTLISIVAQAQTTEEPQFFYRADVKIDGKIYEVYQTQSGQNMLASKEQMNKRGVFIFKKWKQLLVSEAMFTASFGPFGDMGYFRINEDQLPNPEDLRTQNSVPEDYTFGEDSDLQSASFRFRLTYRPHFYRHLRSSLAVDFLASPDESAKHVRAGPHWWVNLDHDVFVTAINTNTLLKLAAGYFKGQTKVRHVFKRPFNSQESPRRYEIDSTINDQGGMVSVQFVTSLDYSFPPTIEVSYFHGQYTRRVQGTLSVGFGTKK